MSQNDVKMDTSLLLLCPEGNRKWGEWGGGGGSVSLSPRCHFSLCQLHTSDLPVPVLQPVVQAAFLTTRLPPKRTLQSP